MCLFAVDMIADMYENGHKANPGSEEILSALFMAYVRLGDYKKQQQVAMKLHRLRPAKNPYYFWAVMSIVMQASHVVCLNRCHHACIVQVVTDAVRILGAHNITVI